MEKTSGSSIAGGPSRLRELDSLRAIAALGIVLWHYAAHFRAMPLLGIFRPFYFAGFYAVDFFFVLSGFVLAKAYWNERRRHTLSENLVRRVARIYPIHLVTLVLVAGGQLILTYGMAERPFQFQDNDLYHFFLNLTLLNFVGLQEGFSFNAPAWSISTEFYVNVLFFFLLAAAGRGLTAASGVLVAASLFVLVALGTGRIDRDGTVLFVQVSVYRTALGFFLGVLLHRFSRDWKPGASRVGWVFDAVFLATGVVLGSWAVGRLGQPPQFEYGVVLVGFPLIVYSAVRSRVVSRVLRLRPLVYLGDISYSLYLVHFPVQLAFHLVKTAGWIDIRYRLPGTLFVFVATSIGLAALSYRFLELPLQRRINQAWAGRSA